MFYECLKSDDVETQYDFSMQTQNYHDNQCNNCVKLQKFLTYIVYQH